MPLLKVATVWTGKKNITETSEGVTMSVVDEKDREGWRIERRVPVMLFLMLGLQMAAALLWAGGMSQRVNELEAAESLQAGVSERLIRQEEKLRHVLEALARIEARLERTQQKSGN
jgi:hypothetical protein